MSLDFLDFLAPVECSTLARTFLLRMARRGQVMLAILWCSYLMYLFLYPRFVLSIFVGSSVLRCYGVSRGGGEPLPGLRP